MAVIADADRPTGAAMACLLATGIGCAVLGSAVIGCEAFPSFKQAMDWWTPAGPLSGKSSVATIVWLASWAALHLAWRRRQVSAVKVTTASAILTFLGFAGTFPPVFEAFAKH
ncbi:MAG: hypothetical protein FD180_430 [Planctomycetota bacterium]|nr:MAG: hypothetical protein FD180_430 [Planctomycetota bacterium]